MDRYFGIIKAARNLINGMPKEEVCENTSEDYRKKFDRLVARTGNQSDIGQLIAEAKKTKKAATWFANRASLIYSLRSRIEHLLTLQDKYQRTIRELRRLDMSADEEGQRWLEAVDEIDYLTSSLKAVQAENPPPREDRVPRHSKRADMRNLPEDWRTMLCRRMRNYEAELAILAATGCRPVEFAMGIKFNIADGMICAHIGGAKLGEFSGQKWRRLYWSIDHPSHIIQKLVEITPKNGSTLLALTDSPAGLTCAIRAAAKREWPSRKSSLTSYCLRHQFGADLKAAGRFTDAEISGALGHRSLDTKTYYGHANMGGSDNLAPARVEFSHAVKAKVNVYRLQYRRRSD